MAGKEWTLIDARLLPYDADLQPEEAEAWFKHYTDIRVEEPTIFTGRDRSRKKCQVARTVATIDFETDPFRGPGYPIRPFAAGFYDGTTYHQWWGSDCPQKLMEHIKGLETPHVIYAHNGGKFDFMYLLDWIDRDVFCIGARIVKANVSGNDPDADWRHELRDSLAIIPVPLRHAAEKGDFDYDKMLEHRREKYKQEISDYLKQDCIGLYDAVTKYRGVFGNAITMAGAAMRKLDEAMQPILGRRKAAVQMSEREDEFYRNFYFGGRVECFENGVIKPATDTLRIYDINSSYPDVMRSCLHPVGTSFRIGQELTDETDFATIRADSAGALPLRNADNGKLDFPHGTFVFNATGHEIRTGIELGLLHVREIIESRTCIERTTFAPFIETYWKARQIAKANHDEVFDLFWKLVMNGAYGKFAQNPRRFTDTMIVRLNEPAPDAGEGWEHSERHELMDIYTRKLGTVFPERLWRSYLNVATGASITGAARAALLRGIAAADRPVYCDTDSILCEGLDGEIVRLDDRELGGWKLEHTGTHAAIHSRKIYALWGERSGDPKIEAHRIKHYRDPYCIKVASKGVRLTAAEVLKAAQGERITYTALAPTFRKDGSQWHQKRTINR